MIEEIRIRDLGVIDEAVLSLHPGLTVLTGETGAGKTMVVTGLGLLLGGRGDSGAGAGRGRPGRRRGRRRPATGATRPSPAPPRRVPTSTDGLVLVRSVSADGRSRAHVGGRAAPVGVLADLAEHLVAVHGQADQWRLRRADQHREVLDGFGGRDVAERALHLPRPARRAHHRGGRAGPPAHGRRASGPARPTPCGSAWSASRRLDPQPGEDTTLGIESQRLGHAEELRAGAGAAHTALSGDDDAGMPSPGVLEALATASSRLASVSGSDPALAEIGTRVDELRYLAADVAADLGSYLADADIDPARLEQVEQRRAALGELTRLYGPTVDDVLRWGGEAARRVGELDGTGDRIGELEARVVDLTGAREEAAGRLTTALARRRGRARGAHHRRAEPPRDGLGDGVRGRRGRRPVHHRRPRRHRDPARVRRRAPRRGR